MSGKSKRRRDGRPYQRHEQDQLDGAAAEIRHRTADLGNRPGVQETKGLTDSAPAIYHWLNEAYNAAVKTAQARYEEEVPTERQIPDNGNGYWPKQCSCLTRNDLQPHNWSPDEPTRLACDKCWRGIRTQVVRIGRCMKCGRLGQKLEYIMSNNPDDPIVTVHLLVCSGCASG